MEEPKKAVPTRRKLLNKDFLLLWQGQLVSQLGMQANNLAVAFWIKHATDSATLMGLVMMAANIPAVVLQPFGGVVADRCSRKMIIVVSDLLCGIAVTAMALLMLFSPMSTNLIVAALFVCSVLVGVLQAFFRPAASAAIPSLVEPEDLNAANSLNQSTFEISILVGSGIGGVLYRILGAPLLFLIDGITYLFSGVTEMFITIPQTYPTDKPPTIKDVLANTKTDTKEGFNYFWKNPGMRSLFLMAALQNFFVTPCIVLLPYYVEDHLRASPDWYGFIMAAIGLGGIVGFLVSGAMKVSNQTRGAMVWWLNIVYALCVVAMGFISSMGVAFALLTFVGFLLAFINVNFTTCVQVATPETMTGRIFGIYGLVAYGIAPISMGFTGIFADFMNRDVPKIYLLCGVVLAAVTILVSLQK